MKYLLLILLSKNKNMKKTKFYHLRPDIFIKESLSFMEGYSKIRIWLYMPVAYIKICYYTIFNK